MNAPELAPDRFAIETGQRLMLLYREIYQRAMRDVPVCNHALTVECIGFRRYGDYAIGVVLTPWFMNLVAVALPDSGLAIVGPDGGTQRLTFVAGEVDFTLSTLTGFGRLLSASLFSPMFDFADMEAARLTADHVLVALLNPESVAPPLPPRNPETVDRRALIRGAWQGGAR
jgi:[NiFe] hydrogenase assembly HybE family chaperone